MKKNQMREPVEVQVLIPHLQDPWLLALRVMANGRDYSIEVINQLAAVRGLDSHHAVAVCAKHIAFTARGFGFVGIDLVRDCGLELKCWECGAVTQAVWVVAVTWGGWPKWTVDMAHVAAARGDERLRPGAFWMYLTENALDDDMIAWGDLQYLFGLLPNRGLSEVVPERTAALVGVPYKQRRPVFP